jgi:hypothetical protein
MDTDDKRLLRQEIKTVNIGLELFGEALRQQGLQVVQVDWRAPADGDPELLDILAQLL